MQRYEDFSETEAKTYEQEVDAVGTEVRPDPGSRPLERDTRRFAAGADAEELQSYQGVTEKPPPMGERKK